MTLTPTDLGLLAVAAALVLAALLLITRPDVPCPGRRCDQAACDDTTNRQHCLTRNCAPCLYGCDDPRHFTIDPIGANR